MCWRNPAEKVVSGEGLWQERCFPTKDSRERELYRGLERERILQMKGSGGFFVWCVLGCRFNQVCVSIMCYIVRIVCYTS